MTTSTDELLARMAEILRAASFSNILDADFAGRLIEEYDALPQRPEGAAVACLAAAMVEGFGEAIESGDLERIRDIWSRRLSGIASKSPPASAVAEPVAKAICSIIDGYISFTALDGLRRLLAPGDSADLYAAPQPAQAATVSRETIYRAVADAFQDSPDGISADSMTNCIMLALASSPAAPAPGYSRVVPRL